MVCKTACKQCSQSRAAIPLHALRRRDGVLGASLAVIAIVAIFLLTEADWIAWLRDNPLNKVHKGEKPNHENLQATLQKLANAQAAA